MRLLIISIALLTTAIVNAGTVTYDFSGATPLTDFNHYSDLNGSSYQVINEQLIPPLVTDFYNTTLELKNPVTGGSGNEITLTADFLYETSLINPNPAEVPGLSLFINAVSSGANGEMRALGSSNTDVVAHSIAYDVNSRNEGNPVVNLEDNTWYRLAFNLQLIGGTFNNELLLTTELYKLDTENELLISSFSVDSLDFLMFQPNSLKVGLNAQGSAGIAAIDNFTVSSSVPIPASFWLFISGLLGFIGFSKLKHA